MLTIEERLEHIESILDGGKVIGGMVREASNQSAMYQHIVARMKGHERSAAEISKLEGRIAQLEERCSTLTRSTIVRVDDINERLDEMTADVDALKALVDPDEPDLSPEEKVSIDEPAGMPPVEKSGVYERANALCAAYYDGDVPGDEAWERVAQESRRLEDEAINRAIDRGLDHCKTIRRLQAELDALRAGDGVPRVSVVDTAAVFDFSVCQFCVENRKSADDRRCDECNECAWRFGDGDTPMPSRFELREDLR